MLAQINFNQLYGSLPGFKFKGGEIGPVVNELVPYFFAAAGFLFLIYLVVSGLEFMFSMGEPKKTAAARGRITNALLGFLIVFASYLIVQIIARIFTITDIQFIFK